MVLLIGLPTMELAWIRACGPKSIESRSLAAISSFPIKTGDSLSNQLQNTQQYIFKTIPTPSEISQWISLSDRFFLNREGSIPRIFPAYVLSA
jgi:hypothetical protein